jgi:hypothetical protein
VTDEAMPEDLLASSSLVPVAEEVKPPPIPPARKSSASFPPLPPRPPSSADLVTSAPAIPAAAPTRPRSVTPEPLPASELGEAAQEQLAAIIHSVLESTLAPAIAKQKELEARLEALQKGLASARVQSQASLSPAVAASTSSAPRPAMISTSYGLVSVIPGPAPRPAIEEALERVGPIDVPDFAGKRKFAGGIVIAILIIAVVGAILATILSYS